MIVPRILAGIKSGRVLSDRDRDQVSCEVSDAGGLKGVYFTRFRQDSEAVIQLYVAVCKMGGESLGLQHITSLPSFLADTSGYTSPDM